MSKHTAGPWRITHDESPDWTGDWYIYAGNRFIVAGNELVGEEIANARLIAAAPDMYEALKWALGSLEGHNAPETVTDGIRSILQKAVGD